MVEEMAPLRSTGYVDPGWEHGIAQDERKKKVKCNYCGKIVSGGIFRLKQHLARISGEVTHCEKVPDEVCLQMRKNLEGCRSGRKRRRSEFEQASLKFQTDDYNSKQEESAGYKHKGKKVVGDKNLIIKLAPLRSLGFVDPGWEHCVPQDERKKKVKCNYCEKIISGGINRFKQHLARIPGEVAYCKNAPEDVYLKIKENMKWHRTGRRHQKPNAKEISPFYMHSDYEDEEEEQGGGILQYVGKDKLGVSDIVEGDDIGKKIRGRRHGSRANGTETQGKRSRLNSVVLKALGSQPLAHHKQVKARMDSDKKTHKKALSAICKFFYHAGIPPNVANSTYFHKMLELVGQYGQGLKGPSTRLIAGRFLQDEVASIKEYLVELKASWASTGCSIMADSWKDLQGRTFINFLVSCPLGVYFASSVDATNMIDDAVNLFKLLDKVVEEIGEENVVQVITENTVTYRTAGKMLEEKRSNLFWTPCAVYCIDQMLEDFLNIRWVGECMEKGKRITKFIYNGSWMLSFMKKEFTEGQELLRPVVTRFAATFSTLQSLLDHRTGLRRMFKSNKWLSSQFAALDEGKEVEKIVLNVTFWKKMQHLRKSLEPVAQVLQKILSDERPSMPSIYNDIYRAKLAIKATHGDDVRKYGPFWIVIDNNWKSLFHHPLYMAAYFLNPSYRYRHDFMMHPEVIRGLNECIVRLEPDHGRRISASMQIPDFVSTKADFGTELAVSTRTELDPAVWWQQHGINCLELQCIAIRILSQGCSSFGCEHHWSAYDQIHSTRHNCLSRKRLNDLTYVHYNLRLQECRQGRKPGGSISVDSVILESVLEDWIVETEERSIQEDKEILYNEMEQSYVDETDENENEDGKAEARKRPAETALLAGVIEPLEVNLAVVSVMTDDDDLDFLDDNLND